MKIIKYILALSLLMGCTIVSAMDTYQWSQGFTGGCDNPTTRTDGEPLPIEEIAEVMYYIDDIDGNLADPEIMINMPGGCQDVQVGTKGLQTQTVYYRYAVAFDTDGRNSIASIPGKPFDLVKANPNAPGQVH
jgi:hypothetical protein